VLRGAPSALSRWPGALPRRAGDGCARKRFQCGDAPIRRSGPPRHRAHSAGGCRSSRPCHVKLPPWCRCRSADARRTIKPPPGAGSAPDDRNEALPVARGPPTGFRGRGLGVSVSLRPHPPRWADVRARRNLTEQPTSRLCSADESVVTSRRCQRPATRSFHGLCGPLQGPSRSAPAWRCLTRKRPVRAEARGPGAPAVQRDGKPPRRRATGPPSRVHPARPPPKRLARRTARGAEAVSRCGAFSTPGREPLAAPWPAPATEAAFADRGSASEDCPE
jgi:hypothetical protein